MVEVRTLRPHLGEGKNRRVGEVYERDEGEAQELRQLGIVEDAPAKAEASLTNKAEPAPANKAEAPASNKAAAK